MDLFIYNRSHRLWICRPCGFAVAVANVLTHLAKRHRNHPSAATAGLREAAVAAMMQDQLEPVFDRTQKPCCPPPPESAPVRAGGRLAYGDSDSQGGLRSPFLWPRGHGPWDSSRLRVVLQREAKTHLQTKLNVITWRHAAIAISRMHLSCGGFKREYEADDAAVDQQAGHGSWAAGTVYARGLQEAPGHIEARRVRYQAVSREWHEFLGFNPGPGVRKRARNMEKSVSRKAQKQQPSYVTVEIDDNIEL
ncbi:predicted protein [Histoplasma mississippiense (nom. inval.)]|uniref:predicted protein n=1 Tax=Ajellomyces capsulatus (strain NAm1 / WU24) TaxID=2059318 RepID=UPI000157C3DD|nr:predicted protein [Histoplasma mississippiense (nom. inval.)]XP_001541927.1 predicted protein [Histoplasma mississippiense (nom. inval.)]EDN06524.1 predicted protein [Histoplasma mississippiense (nom. inval.)]EDN07494.1 predicted protein [Histoplasma mississippiense (nom. inval.)]